MHRLVLWDIDGTLVHTAGYGRNAFADAFREVFGRDAHEALVPMAGRTDHDIALAVLERNGVDAGELHLTRFSAALADALAAREPDIRREGHVMPGVREALEALAGRQGVVQSLLTGNIEPNAVVKLAAFGLEGLVDWDVGAFGSDHRIRARLVEIAREKARAKYEVPYGPGETVLVGDTPLDVRAGREGGARVVAVATGPFSVEELLEAGADAALGDLRDTAAAVEAILSPR